MATTVRVDDKLHQTLRAISASEDRSIGQVIEEAIARYQREKFWEGVQADFARLRADPEAWEDYQREIAEWDAISGDPLAGEAPYYTPEELAGIDGDVP